MESTGRPGAIQMTRASYERLCDEFECEPGGIIPVKGKGDTGVWYLTPRTGRGSR